MRRVLAALAVCAVGACSTPQAPSEPKPRLEATPADEASKHARRPSPEADRVADTLRRVSAMRGIAATRAVPSVTLEREQLVARVKDKALREYPPEALRREGRILQIVGLAPKTFDYLGAMLQLLGAQLEGFYEPKNGTMYLASELKGAAAQATLAHELVHALQDQSWDLRKRSDFAPGRSDERMAAACLAEGDATSLMLDFVMKPAGTAIDVPPDSLRELMRSGMNIGDVGAVPHILRSTLVAPYTDGIAFVHELRRKGGWTAVDRAWERLPTTTEQILHVAKWEAHEGPITVPAPSGAALGEGWTNEDQDTFGELGLALAFGEWMSDEDARLAASGWGGDRTSIFTKDSELAYAVHLRFDEAPKPAKPGAYADRARTTVGAALKKNLGKPAIDDATTICFDRKELGPLLFARKDREFVMLAGPARVAGDTWTATATCKVAKTWADEVLAQQ